MHPLARFLRYFFHHLYHGLAWSYPWVSNAVSFGHWDEWAASILPLLGQGRALELGHGLGHLQAKIRRETALRSAALDESAQMSHLAAQHLRRAGMPDLRLVRGVAQHLPFGTAAFETVLCTFPSDYIFDPKTLAEIWRVLKQHGRLVALPVAWPSNALLAWLFRVTGESPAGAIEMAREKLGRPFRTAGFAVEVRRVALPSSTVLIILAEKSSG